MGRECWSRHVCYFASARHSLSRCQCLPRRMVPRSVTPTGVLGLPRTQDHGTIRSRLGPAKLLGTRRGEESRDWWMRIVGVGRGIVTMYIAASPAPEAETAKAKGGALFPNQTAGQDCVASFWSKCRG